MEYNILLWRRNKVAGENRCMKILMTIRKNNDDFSSMRQ